MRNNTSINLCLVELGIHPLQERGGKTFVESELLSGNVDEPFNVIYELCCRTNTPGYRFLTQALLPDQDKDQLPKTVTLIRTKPLNATKYVTYGTEFNPSLTNHHVYESRKLIPRHPVSGICGVTCYPNV